MHLFALVVVFVITIVSATPILDSIKRESFCGGLIHETSCTPGYNLCCGTGKYEGDIYMKCNSASDGITVYSEEYCPGGTICVQESGGEIHCD